MTNYVNLKYEIGRLKNIVIYFSIDEIPKHYQLSGIHTLEYYNYHYERFRIKSISLVDYLLLFVNHCLQMGIPVNKCNIYSITDNTNLKNSDLVKSLKDFDSAIAKLRGDRNKIIHQGNFEPRSMTTLNDVILEQEENIIIEADIENGKLKSEEISKAIEHFEIEILMIKNHVEKVFNNLIPHINEQVEVLELRDNKAIN